MIIDASSWLSSNTQAPSQHSASSANVQGLRTPPAHEVNNTHDGLSAGVRKPPGNETAGRGSPISRRYGNLVANEFAGADLKHLASETVRPLMPGANRLTVTGPSLQLSLEATTSLCLVLHELATNAV